MRGLLPATTVAALTNRAATLLRIPLEQTIDSRSGIESGCAAVDRIRTER